MQSNDARVPQHDVDPASSPPGPGLGPFDMSNPEVRAFVAELRVLVAEFGPDAVMGAFDRIGERGEINLHTVVREARALLSPHWFNDNLPQPEPLCIPIREWVYRLAGREPPP